MVGKLDQIQNEISDMPGSILEAAKENATNLINSGFGGHVRVYPDRILIMDTKDEMTAKRFGNGISMDWGTLLEE